MVLMWRMFARRLTVCRHPPIPHKVLRLSRPGTEEKRLKSTLQSILGIGEEGFIPTVSSEYYSRVRQKRLREDPAQVLALSTLDILLQSLREDKNRKCSDEINISAGVLGRQADRATSDEANPPQDLSSCVTGAARENSREPSDVTSTSGVYLWGSVGSGKTMLMDLLVAAARKQGPQATGTSPLHAEGERQLEAESSVMSVGDPSRPVGNGSESKELRLLRLHFHEFMLTTHKHLHHLHKSLPRVVSSSRDGLPVYRYAALASSPVEVVASSLASQVDLLLLDELHVADVADALLLGRLFEIIMSCGTRVAFTSNQPPEKLYLGGLNRKFFMPFVRLVRDRCLVHEVDNGVDYRQASPSMGGGEAGCPLPEERALAGEVEKGGWVQSARLPELWAALSDSPEMEMDIPVGFGRNIHIPRAVETGPRAAHAGTHMSYLRFAEMCGERGLKRGLDDGGALGPADLLALARTLHTVFLEGVPLLTWKQQDEARRLIAFLLIAYEERCRLFFSAHGTPAEVFSNLIDETKERLGSVRNDAAAGPGARNKTLDADRLARNLLAEELLMYQRAVSRLAEMCPPLED